MEPLCESAHLGISGALSRMELDVESCCQEQLAAPLALLLMQQVEPPIAVMGSRLASLFTCKRAKDVGWRSLLELFPASGAFYLSVNNAAPLSVSLIASRLLASRQAIDLLVTGVLGCLEYVPAPCTLPLDSRMKLTPPALRLGAHLALAAAKLGDVVARGICECLLAARADLASARLRHPAKQKCHPLSSGLNGRASVPPAEVGHRYVTPLIVTVSRTVVDKFGTSKEQGYTE